MITEYHYAIAINEKHFALDGKHGIALFRRKGWARKFSSELRKALGRKHKVRVTEVITRELTQARLKEL